MSLDPCSGGRQVIREAAILSVRKVKTECPRGFHVVLAQGLADHRAERWTPSVPCTTAVPTESSLNGGGRKLAFAFGRKRVCRMHA